MPIDQELALKNALLEQENAELKREIKRRIGMEDALQKSEAGFRKLVTTLPLPLAIVNHAGMHTFINDKFVQVFGYDYDDLPTREKWRELAFPDQKYRSWVAETWAAEVESATKTKPEIGPIECDITCKNGAVRSVMVSGIITNEEVLATFIDVTESRRHEQAMKKAYERRRKNELMAELIQKEIPSKQAIHESARLMGANLMASYSCFLVVIDEQPSKTRAEHVDEHQLLMDSVLNAVEADNRFVWESPAGIGVLCFEADGVQLTNAAQKNWRKNCVRKYSGRLRLSRFPSVSPNSAPIWRK